MTFAEKLKFYREKLDISQNELAEKSQILATNIRKYETGVRTPKPDALNALSEALEVSPNVFLEAKNETIGDISALFFLLSKCADLEIHGEKIDGKYSADSVSFSFSHPLLQEFLADWASSTESARELRRTAKNFKEEEIQKPMLESAETLERTLEYNKVSCKIKV